MSLITSTTYKLIKQLFYTSKLGTTPFVWNDARNRLELQEKAWAKRRFILSIMIFSVIALFVQIRAIQVNYDDHWSIEEKFTLRLQAVSYFSCWFVQVWLYWERRRIVSFLNMYLDFLEHCQVAYKMELLALKITHKRFYAALIQANFSRVNLIIEVCLVIINPRNPEQIHTIFVTSEEPGITERAFTGAYVFIFAMAVVECIGVVFVIIIFFVFTVSNLGCLMCSMLTSESTSMLKFRRTCKLYRALYLLSDEFSEVFKLMLGYIHVAIIIIIVYCVYVTVRLTGADSVAGIFWALNSLLLMYALEAKYAELNTSSKKFLQQLKIQNVMRTNYIVQRAHRKLFRLESRYFRECRIRVGSLFYYDTDLLVSTMEIVLQNSINLILIH